MRKLGCFCVAMIASMVLSTSALCREATPIAMRSDVPVQTGVFVETNVGDFKLVTLGNWSVRQQNALVQPPSLSGRPSPAQPLPPGGKGREAADSFRRAAYLLHVQAAERRYALPPGLLDALIWTESRYNPLALSKAGAAGLGQLMPRTAHALGVHNRYDASANLFGAARYLRQLLDQFGAVHLAVAAYNAGPGTVLASGGIPQTSETPGYVRSVLSAWRSLSSTFASPH
jgi:soluble lytic murein transglycosylase-like protein